VLHNTKHINQKTQRLGVDRGVNSSLIKTGFDDGARFHQLGGSNSREADGKGTIKVCGTLLTALALIKSNPARTAKKGKATGFKNKPRKQRQKEENSRLSAQSLSMHKEMHSRPGKRGTTQLNSSLLHRHRKNSLFQSTVRAKRKSKITLKGRFYNRDKNTKKPDGAG